MSRARRGGTSFFLLLLTLVVVACRGGAPGTRVAEGTPWTDDEGYQVTVPDDWERTDTRAGARWIRRTPYGDGLPSLTVRCLAAGVPATVIGATSTELPAGQALYRYERWANSRGRGWRLEALLTTPSGERFEWSASVWDPSPEIDPRFFRDEIWPIIASLKAPIP